MKTLFTYIILAILFVGVANAQPQASNTVVVLSAVRGVDANFMNRSFIPLKWSGTQSDTSWKIIDTTSAFNVSSMRPGDSTLVFWISVPRIAKDGPGAATANMYKMAIALQWGNSATGVWRPAVVIDSIGQYGTKQRYAASLAWAAVDSALVSRTVWSYWQGSGSTGLAAKNAQLVGCDQVRALITKDTTNCAIIWGQTYMTGFRIRGGN